MSSIPHPVVAGSTVHTPVMLPVVCVACYAASDRDLPSSCILSPCPRHHVMLSHPALRQHVEWTCTALIQSQAPTRIINALRVAMQEIDETNHDSPSYDSLDAALAAAQYWIEHLSQSLVTEPTFS